MDLAEAIQTQRAIRRLKPDPVDDEVVMRCLSLAVKAPTGGNQQGWRFIVVRDREVKAALARQYRMAWAVYGRAGRLLRGGDESTKKTLDAVQWQVDHFEEIPVVIVPCLKGLSFGYPWVMRTSRYGSIYPAIQNLLLAARAEGLGAALITLPLWNRLATHKILGLPYNVEPVAVIPLGWPRGRYGPTTRMPVERVVYYDRYGNRKPKEQT